MENGRYALAALHLHKGHALQLLAAQLRHEVKWGNPSFWLGMRG